MAYAITVTQAQNGEVAVFDADGNQVTEADEGAALEVVAEGGEGYAAASITVDGADCPDGLFEMPAHAVSVSATFVEVEEVRISLDQVAEAAENTQWFWTDTDGAHVTDVPQDEWADAAADGFQDVSASKPYHNSLWNSAGMFFRSALANLLGVTRSGIKFFDGLGNVVAEFGSNVIRLGHAYGVGSYVDFFGGKGRIGYTDQGGFYAMQVESDFAIDIDAPHGVSIVRGDVDEMTFGSVDLTSSFTTMNHYVTDSATGEQQSATLGLSQAQAFVQVTDTQSGGSALVSVAPSGVEADCTIAASGFSANGNAGLTQTLSIGGRQVRVEGGLIVAVN